jgi:mRNA interferase HigB
MNVLTKTPFVEAARKCPNDRDALLTIYRVLSKGEFPDPLALKAVFPTLNNFKYVDKWWVIDVGGNNLRLVACILFKSQMVYVKGIFSHADYDKFTAQYRGKKRS